MGHRALTGLLVAAVLSTAGCSAASESHGGDAATAPAQEMAMPRDGMATTSGPSDAAQMICSDEIAGAVARTFELDATPLGTSSWSDGVFTCDYEIGSGTLSLSVDDASRKAAGHASFERLRSKLAPVRRIRGMENFGFPAFDTPAGQVVFLKDGKTLVVDASTLRAGTVPDHVTRADAAYGVAAAVIGCWTE